MTIEVRLVTAEDAEALADLLEQHAAGLDLPCTVLDDGRVVGRTTLTANVRGAFPPASAGCWTSPDARGRGVGTAAVRAAAATAFGELGLHRLQADTLVHDAASRRVLAETGFEAFGTAPRSPRIAGRWQDCVVHQLLAPDRGDSPGTWSPISARSVPGPCPVRARSVPGPFPISARGRPSARRSPG